MDAAALLAAELTPFQRLLATWLFVAVGLLIAVQVSQTQAEQPPRWARLTNETKKYWFAVYVLDAFLLVQSAYPLLRKEMTLHAGDYGEKVLDAIWIGLLGLEVLMVFGIAVQGVFRRYSQQPKQKTS